VDVPSGDGRGALEDFDRVEFARRRLLFVDAGEQQSVVEDDGVDDQPRALVPYLLLVFRLDAELA